MWDFDGLFHIFTEKLNSQHNEVLSMEYVKLSRHFKETAEEWLGRTRIKPEEYKYNEADIHL